MFSWYNSSSTMGKDISKSDLNTTTQQSACSGPRWLLRQTQLSTLIAIYSAVKQEIPHCFAGREFIESRTRPVVEILMNRREMTMFFIASGITKLYDRFYEGSFKRNYQASIKTLRMYLGGKDVLNTNMSEFRQNVKEKRKLYFVLRKAQAVAWVG